MKNAILVSIVVIISLAAGFSGGFASGIFYHQNQVSPHTAISEFALLAPIIENGSFDGATFNATSSGPANFQIGVSNSTFHLTLASGSFYKSINYTDLSLGSGFLLGGLKPGTYNISLQVFSGNSLASGYKTLTILPKVHATITGPHNVNDTSSAQDVTFHASIIGGKSPYKYYWNISNDYYYGNVQNYTYANNESSSFSVTYFANPIISNSYGFDASYFITLTVVDSLGYSYSISYPGYTVDVTGE